MTERIQGRGSAFNPANRFEKLRIDDHSDDVDAPSTDPINTVYFRDTTKSILAKNDSPDIPFTFSINPYRGCEHGCIYCYARPTHEFLGFSAGLDFETKIMVKTDAPQLLEDAFRSPSFEPQVIALSGNTDCYQPAERSFKITRGLLEVFLKYKNPVGIITKNALVLRDIDLLQELANWNLVKVTVSITSLNASLISRMEPRTSTPDKRLATIRALSVAGIPVGVNAAPMIPGLTDEELPEILRRSSEMGALYAGYILMRLPFAVKELFTEWVNREFPQRAGKILNRVRDTRSGNLNDPRFGSRMTGEGEIAKAIETLFDLSCKRYHLNEQKSALTTEHFQRIGQLSLFQQA
jgi:DNA repair photolyase